MHPLAVFGEIHRSHNDCWLVSCFSAVCYLKYAAPPYQTWVFLFPLFVFLGGFLTIERQRRPRCDLYSRICPCFFCGKMPSGSESADCCPVLFRFVPWNTTHETRCPDEQGGRGPNGEQRVTFLPPGGARTDFCNRRRIRRKWEPWLPPSPSSPRYTLPACIWPGAPTILCGWISNGPIAAISESGDARLQTRGASVLLPAHLFRQM